MFSPDLTLLIEKAFDQRDREIGTGVNVFVLIEMGEFNRISTAMGQETTEILGVAFHERVRGFLRANDHLLDISHKRCGVILTHIQNTGQLDLAAAKLFRQFETPIDVVDQKLRIKVHAAFVVPTKARTTVARLVDDAERCLVEARSYARCYAVVKANKPAENAVDDWQTDNELAEAFERGEFRSFFQPRVHATFRSTIGAEARLHWASSKRGLIPLETLGESIRDGSLGKPITWFGIRSAVAACRHWPDYLTVAVNLYPNVLVDGEIVEILKDTLGFYDLKPDRLTLEVAENDVMKDSGTCLSTLKQIRHLGVRISIDKFGTGYSSLSQLCDIPADELKIDKCFITVVPDSAPKTSLVKSIVDIAHNLDLLVVAEGITGEQTADTLRDLGCDVLQGNLFGETCGAKEIADFFATNRTD